MGVDGQRQEIVDNRGKIRQILGLKEAIPGKNLQLTIDLDVQAVAELTMENRRGAVVALDPRNGEGLAMVSHPAYNPNLFPPILIPTTWTHPHDTPANPH